MKIEKPSSNHIYVLKFPKYITSWRLICEKDGFLYFTTNTGRNVEKMTLERFNYLCRRFLIETINLSDYGIATTRPERIKITIERSSAYQSKAYTSDELQSLVDDIDDVIF